MAGLKFNVFSGMRPRVPESLLAASEAAVAENCDFAYGELRNIKQGWELWELGNTPKSLYTDDGLTFYSWEHDVHAVRSPMVNDTFDRMYYTGQGGLHVANRLMTKTAGGEPASAYRVGVPQPTVPPVLVAQPPPTINRVNADIKFRFHYEQGGVKYQEQDIFPDALSDVSYRFTPPKKAEETPSQGFPVIRMTAHWRSDNSQALDLYSSNSSMSGAISGIYGLEISKDEGKDVGTYTASLSIQIKESDKDTRAYVYTYVNMYGEEGPPSPPALVTTSPVVTVSVQCTKDAHTGYSPIREIRIYRTPTGSAIADYFFVGMVPALADSTFVFDDKTKAEMLNEPLSSDEFYPPDPALRGLMLLPNGVLCAYKGNELHFSEAYKPWAWPPKYVKTLPTNIVGSIVHGSGAVVTTRAHPYLVSGVSPDAMTASKINVDQAGVSRHAIAVVDGAVMYASNDGIVTINGATASLAQGQRFFTRDVWRKRYAKGLHTMHFAVWDGRLVVFSSSNAFVPFMVRFDEADGTMTDLPDFVAQASVVNPQSDLFYYVQGNRLLQFNGGPEADARWQSAECVLPVPINFGAAHAVVEGDWRVMLYASNRQAGDQPDAYELVHMEHVRTGAHHFRLPGGYESDRYRIVLQGQGRFRELRIAKTFRELATL